jgi:hypothetical protein
MRSLASFLSASLAALGLAIGLAGCQQLFTTSLAKSLARGSISLPSNLSASDAADLAKQAKDNNDTKLATALVDNLVAQIGTPPDPAALAALGASAASAAITASGVDGAITDLISSFADNTTPTSQALIDLVAKIQAGATTDVVTALSYLDAGLSADDIKAAGLGATDLAIAAVVIAAGALPAGLDPSTLSGADLTTFQASPEYATANNILNEAKLLVDPGSQSEKLLNDLLANFSM